MTFCSAVSIIGHSFGQEHKLTKRIFSSAKHFLALFFHGNNKFSVDCIADVNAIHI